MRRDHTLKVLALNPKEIDHNNDLASDLAGANAKNINFEDVRIMDGERKN